MTDDAPREGCAEGLDWTGVGLANAPFVALLGAAGSVAERPAIT